MLRSWNLAVFLLVIFLGGGLVAPWVWWLAQGLAGPGSEDWARSFAGHPFYRYVHRCLLAVALIGLVPFLRAMGAGSWGSMGLGKPERGTWRGLWLTGFAIGAGMFAMALGLDLALGLRIWRADQGMARIAWVLASSLGASLVVGLLEEPLFRGALCRGLSESVGWPMALAVSSVIYGWVHFLGKVPSPDPVTWDAGLKVVGSMVRVSLDVRGWLPGMPTLVLAGILLGRLLQRTGSLWAPIGLHTGWVFFIKARGSLTAASPGAGSGMGGWGGGESRVSAGWTGLAAVAVAMVVFEWLASRSEGVQKSYPGGAGSRGAGEAGPRS